MRGTFTADVKRIPSPVTLYSQLILLMVCFPPFRLDTVVKYHPVTEQLAISHSHRAQQFCMLKLCTFSKRDHGKPLKSGATY